MEKNCGVGGIMAPTLRYQDGIFYILCANFADKGNFIITATEPRGPWSAIHHLEDIPGIDASLFFDTDGKAYVMGTGNVWDNGTGVKERGIWLAPYDVQSFHIKGEPVTIFNSAMRGGASPEAPHLFHVGDYYYLMIAEGGTEHYHSVMVARSADLFGFYTNYPGNPAMTHRHMGFTAEILNVGHADLVETPEGQWYAVMLASRLIGGKYKNLGRETFLCPVIWERDWPLFSPASGRLDWTYEAPKGPLQPPYPPEPTFDSFTEPNLRPYWTLWGTPQREICTLQPGSVSLACIAQALDDPLRPMAMDGIRSTDHYVAFLARRQRAMHETVTTSMTFHPADQEKAGLAVVQAMNHQLHLQRICRGDQQLLQAVLVTADYNCPPYFPGFHSETSRRVLAEVPYESDHIVLQADLDGEAFTLRYGGSRDQLSTLTTVDGGLINPEKVGCMCGTMLGMFATGGGTDSDNKASFDFFSVERF